MVSKGHHDACMEDSSHTAWRDRGGVTAHHLARGKDERGGLWVADAHDDRRKPLHNRTCCPQ